MKKLSEMSGGRLKQIQLEIILRENPMRDEFHRGVREIGDICTFDEGMKNEDSWVYPDFSFDDCVEQLKKNDGMIRVFSSKKIIPGVFVSPSKMCAQDYAGGRGHTVFSVICPPEFVAWMGALDEGIFCGEEIKKEIRR